jgi:DNA-binding ferritin-like protein
MKRSSPTRGPASATATATAIAIDIGIPARSVFPLADKAADEAKADQLTQRLQLHEKTAWMLRSQLG